MKEYRILAIGIGSNAKYKVQKKCLWWWNDERTIEPRILTEIPITVVKWFDSPSQAQAHILRDEPRIRKPVVIMQTILVE